MGYLKTPQWGEGHYGPSSNNKLHRPLEQKALMSKSTELETRSRKTLHIGGSAGESVRCPQSLCCTNSSDYHIGNCARIDVHASH